VTPSNTIVRVLICLVTFSHMLEDGNLMTITERHLPTSVVGSGPAYRFRSGIGGSFSPTDRAAGSRTYPYRHIHNYHGAYDTVAFLVFRLLVKGPSSFQPQDRVLST